MNAILAMLRTAAPELIKAAAPSLVRMLAALLRGDEDGASKHARIGALKVKAKLELRRHR